MDALPATLDAVFRKIEEQTEPLSEDDVSSALHALHKELEKAGDTPPPELLAESMAFDLCEDYHDEDTGWGTYYGPMVVVRRDGKAYGSPSIQRVTPDILDYWQARSQEASHPLLRIRYADLVWDLSPKIREKTANVICAQTVIDSSADLVAKRLFEHPTDVRDKLERALSIALSIKDKGRIELVATTIIALEDDAAELDKLGTWGYGFDLLVANKKVPLSADQEHGIIDQMENYLAQAATINRDSGYPLDHFSAKAAAIRLARYYERLTRRDDVRRVLTLYAAAVKASAKNVMAMLGVSWLRQAYDVLVKYGVKDKADAVAVLMRELGQGIQKEMVRTTHTMEITKEEVDAYIASMMAGSEREVIARICLTFLPNSDKVKEQLQDMASRFPLWSLFDQSLIDEEGREISRVGSVKNDLDGRIVREMCQNMELETFWLGVALREWVKRFDVTADRVLQHLQSSPLFPADRQELLKSGLDAYLRGEHIAAVHILVPQIEQAFRSLLTMTGQNIYKPGRNHALHMKTLDDLLRDPVATHVFGDDRVRYFKVLLTDQRGWNLRNNICHGLINTPSGNPVLSDRLVHALLVLSMVERACDDSDGSATEQPTEP